MCMRAGAIGILQLAPETMLMVPALSPYNPLMILPPPPRVPIIATKIRCEYADYRCGQAGTDHGIR